MSVGYGLVPYGIGDWGSLNTVIPDTGAIAAQGNAPTVDSGVIPTGQTVLVGSAPVVVVIERVKTPGTADVSIVGAVSTVIQNYRIEPATNDLNLLGAAPRIDKAIIPGSAALTIANQTSLVDVGIKTTTGSVGIVGQTPTVIQAFFIQPAANDAVFAGIAPSIELSSVITPSTGAVTAAGVAPIVDKGRLTVTGAVTLVGAAPSLAVAIEPSTGAIAAQGYAPLSSEGDVITPTGVAVILGGVPSVVVRGVVRVPSTGAASLVGQVPVPSRGVVLTPPTAVLNVVGNAPIIDNPNWVNINDSQTPNWVGIAA